MRCPFCSSDDTRVIDSRIQENGESVRRRRECQFCNRRFTTSEYVVLELPDVLKEDGRRERFEEEKIRRGISRATEKRSVGTEAIDDAVRSVMSRFYHRIEKEIPAKEIGEAVMRELKTLDEVSYIRFASVYRDFQNPDAFSDEVEKLKGTP